MENIINLDEMTAESEAKIAEIEKDIIEKGSIIHKKMIENLKTFPEKLMKEMEIIEKDNKIPDTVAFSSTGTSSNFENFTYVPPGYNATEEDIFIRNEREKKTLLNTLNLVLKRVEAVREEVDINESIGAYETTNKMLETLPTVTITYKIPQATYVEEEVKTFGVTDHSILSLSIDIEGAKRLVNDFRDDIRKNSELKDSRESAMDLANSVLENPLIKEIIDNSDKYLSDDEKFPTEGEGVLWTKNELRILKSIYEGKPLDMSYGTKGKEKDRMPQERKGDER